MNIIRFLSTYSRVQSERERGIKQYSVRKSAVARSVPTGWHGIDYYYKRPSDTSHRSNCVAMTPRPQNDDVVKSANIIINCICN